MRVLVTGSHGFLGRHFVKHLTDANCDVVGIDDLSNGLPMQEWAEHLLPTKGRFSFFIEDVTEFLPYHRDKYDLVIHCAGVIGGRKVIEEDPVQHVRSIEIDAVMAQWMVRSGNKRLLYLSSSAVYPTRLQGNNKDQSSLFETDQRIGDVFERPDMMYGWSKLNGEVMFKMLSEAYRINVLSIRPFSGYGEDQGDEYPMTAIVKRALTHEDPLTVWGSGQQGRDFIYVDDLCQMAVKKVITTKGYEMLNLGSGQVTTFKKLAEIIAEEVGYKTEIKPLSSEPEGVFTRVADVWNMQEQVGLPKTSLREGVRKVIEYQRGKQ